MNNWLQRYGLGKTKVVRGKEKVLIFWLYQEKALSLHPVNVLSLNDDGNTTSCKTTQKGDQG